MAPVPPTLINDEVVVTIVPLVFVTLPFKDNVLLPTVRGPFVKTNSPSTERLAANVTPLALLMVTLFIVDDAIYNGTAAALPPIIRLDVVPPVIVPLLRVTVPFSVTVFAPIDNVPAASVSVPSTVRVACIVTVPEVMVRLAGPLAEGYSASVVVMAEDGL